MWLSTVALLVLLGVPLLDLLLLSWRDHPSLQWVEKISVYKQELAREMGGAGRLLVVGGSSGLFSVDAELLEARLGLPTINLATHAGLGLRYLLADARAAARSGDTVLLYLEYAHYRTKPFPLLELEQQAIWTMHPERLLQLPPVEALRQIYGLPLSEYPSAWARRNREMRGEVPERLYSMVEFGLRGDYRAAAPMEKAAPALDVRPYSEPRAAALQELERFLRWCRQHGVRVVAARSSVVRWPGLTPAEEDRAYGMVEPFYKAQQVPLLETRSTFQLPAELFFDTSYHAHAAGRRIITEALAHELAGVLDKPRPAEDGSILLVAASRSGWSRDLVLSRGAAPECRFLAARDLQHPLCVTPAQVRQLCTSGRRVIFADPEVGTLLAAEHLSLELLEQKTNTLQALRASSPDRLFLMAQVGNLRTDLQSPELPPAWNEFLRSPLPKVGLFGTGRLAEINISEAEANGVTHRETARAPWQRAFRHPMEISLSTKLPPGSSSLIVQGSPLGLENTPGLAVAVIDLQRGVVERCGVFTGTELVDWQLFRVTAPLP